MKEYKKWLKVDIELKESDIAISSIFVKFYLEIKWSKILKNGPILTFFVSYPM